VYFDIRINPPSTVAPNPPEWAGYEKTLPHHKNLAPFADQPFSRFVKMLDGVGVKRGLLIVGPNATIEDQPKHIKDLVDQAPERFVGAVTIVPKPNLMDSVKEIERGAKDFGIRAVLLRPFQSMLYANDRRFYPIYAKCTELGLVASIVVGMNFSSRPNLEYATPVSIDSVAAEFPDLKIIMTHSGWPWAAEAVSVAWKHPNVYIDISGIGPRFIAMDGTGYEPLFKFGSSVLQDKMLWGTDWPLIDHTKSISEMNALPLKDEVREKWMYKNAMNVFGLKE
jgi:predicted TIM-barrel fold metal-dependent hydrolase